MLTRPVALVVTTFVTFVAAFGVIVGGAPAPAHADEVRERQLPALESLGVLQAQQQSKGKGVTVAVVDSGVDANHPDLAGSVTVGPDYTKGANPPGVPPVRQHGTFMASLAAGHGHGPGQGSGVIGVAPAARILAIRVAPEKGEPGFIPFNTQRRFRNAVAKGIRHAADRNADVINLSLGKSSATPEERAAITHAISRGTVVVAAVGNDGDSNRVDADGFAPFSYPAALPGVIAVAAVDVNKRPANFSNRNASVQVAAPGVEVIGAGPRRQYLIGDGTSQATALVSGVAALIRSRHPKMSPALVSQAIVASTVNRPSVGYDTEVGFGTVNAAKALAEAGRLAKYKETAGLPGSRRLGGSAAGAPVEVVHRDPLRLGGFGGLAIFALVGFAASMTVVAMNRRREAAAPAASYGTSLPYDEPARHYAPPDPFDEPPYGNAVQGYDEPAPYANGGQGYEEPAPYGNGGQGYEEPAPYGGSRAAYEEPLLPYEGARSYEAPARPYGQARSYEEPASPYGEHRSYGEPLPPY